MGANHGDFYALLYRVRSARNKKRSLKADFNKRLIHLHKLECKLWDAEENLPWVPLPEPYQKGWKRYFVLREDSKRSNNAAFYRSLLDKINTIQYSKDKAFTVKKRRKRRKVHELMEQSLREFYEWEWNDPRFKLTENEKKHFYRKETWSHKSNSILVKYVFTEPGKFVLQVRPHIITHTKMIDEALEREIQLLENHIVRNNLRHKILQITNGRRQRWRKDDSENPKYKNPLKNKPLHSILDDYKWEIIDHPISVAICKNKRSKIE